MRSRPAFAVLTAAFVLVCTTGCAGMLGILAPGNGPYRADSSSTDAGGATSSVQVGSPVGDEEVDAEIDAAVQVVNTFWADHFSDFYTGGEPYQPPAVGGAYTADAPPICGGEPLEPFNAYYCSGDHTLWWDADLMNAAFESGDAVVYLVVAHEWGHAIQQQIDDVWVAEELQADCFAAAALYGAADDDDFLWEAGDTAEITHGLTSLADETAWTDTTDHGDPLDRIDAFNDGRISGVEGCYTVDE